MGEKQLLESCYKKSLALAKEIKAQSIAFPLISAGVYGYPKDKAIKVAMDVISDFLLENDMMVYMVIFDKTAFKLSEKLFADIEEYIDEVYVEEHTDTLRRFQIGSAPMATVLADEFCPSEDMAIGSSLDEELKLMDESFAQMLLRKIDEKGMTDAQSYKKANIDRKLFSKIRSDIHYRPSKPTAIAFAIALELPLAEAEDMLKKAGFALSHSNKFDIIIQYFIGKGNYNIHVINEALFAFDQCLLGV